MTTTRRPSFAGAANAGATPAPRLRTGFERAGRILALGKGGPREIVSAIEVGGMRRKVRVGESHGAIFAEDAEFAGHTVTVECAGTYDGIGLLARMADREGNALVQAACALTPSEEIEIVAALRDAARELRASAMTSGDANGHRLAALRRADLLDALARDAERLSRAPTGAELIAMREAAE